MKRMLLASAMVLATMTAALAAEGIDATPVTDYFITVIFTVVTAIGGWLALQLQERLGLARDSAAMEVLRRVMADSLQLGEVRVRELAKGATFRVGNERVEAIVNNIVEQAPAEVRRLGYSEQYLAQWAMNQMGMAPAPAQAPDGYVGNQGLT